MTALNWLMLMSPPMIIGNRSPLLSFRAATAQATANLAKNRWWAFLDTYRTLCLAPTPEIRDIFEQVRDEPYLALLLLPTIIPHSAKNSV
jgi:hypothetical protein